MKKIHSKYIALGGLMFLGLSYSCKRLLNQEPVGSLSSTTLANKAGVDGLLIGAYSLLDGFSNNYGTGWETSTDNWVYGGVGSDDAYKGSSTGDQPNIAPIENHSLDPSNEFMEEKWHVGLASVQRCNDVINEIPLVKDGSVSSAYATEVIAEARFLRGFYNMELSKVFRNVPYVDETINYNAGNYMLPNPGPIWDKIEADFIAAMAGLPKTQSQAGRANYYAAEAFLAKAYMFDHQEAKALPLLTDLINNGTTASGQKYALGAYEDNFMVSTKNSPESVFAAQNTVNDGSGGANDNAGNALNYSAGTTGCCGFYEPSMSLANSFKVDANGLPMFGSDANGLPTYDTQNLANDHGYVVSPNTHLYTLGGSDTGTPFTPPTDAVDPRLDWTVGRYGIPYLDWGLCQGEQWARGDAMPYNPKKNLYYKATAAATTDNFAGWAAGQGTALNINLLRFSDVILWRAECYVEGGQLALAEADVNTVRARMQNTAYWVHTYVDNSDPSKGNTNTPAANYKIGLYTGQFAANGQDYARKAVWMERKLEFGMEGMRFFDLQRYDGLYGGHGGSGYMAGVINAYIKADTRLTGTDKTVTNPVLSGGKFTAGKNELYPIPQHEVDIEAGKLKQNPGY